MNIQQIQQAMKKAEEVQKNVMRVKDELSKRTVTGSAGGGMVTATMNGDGVLTGMKIDPSTVDLSELDVLEDLVTAAVNNAKKSVDSMGQKAMSELGISPELMGGLGF